MNNSFEDIKGKVCIVTGGCGVFGRHFSSTLLDAGGKIVVLAHRKVKCADCPLAKAEKEGAPVLCIASNVLDKEELIKAKKEINEKFGKIDVLVNCAGGNAPTATTANEFMTKDNKDDLAKSFFGLDLEGFKSVFDLNFLGTVLPSMVFAEDMIERGGSIINISSMNSFRPLTKIPAYSAAKSSINNFTAWLAVHFAKVNIRVNAIAPGFYLTKQNEFLMIDPQTKQLSARGNKIITATPMGRFGVPDDLNGTLLYLASDISKFVTGIVIPVDGGFSAYSGV